MRVGCRVRPAVRRGPGDPFVDGPDPRDRLLRVAGPAERGHGQEVAGPLQSSHGSPRYPECPATAAIASGCSDCSSSARRPPTNIAESPCTRRIGRSPANQRSPGAWISARRSRPSRPGDPLKDRCPDMPAKPVCRVHMTHYPRQTAWPRRPDPCWPGRNPPCRARCPETDSLRVLTPSCTAQRIPFWSWLPSRPTPRGRGSKRRALGCAAACQHAKLNETRRWHGLPAVHSCGMGQPIAPLPASCRSRGAWDSTRSASRSARSSRAAGVRAATRPGSAATRLASARAPTAVEDDPHARDGWLGTQRRQVSLARPSRWCQHDSPRAAPTVGLCIPARRMAAPLLALSRYGWT